MRRLAWLLPLVLIPIVFAARYKPDYTDLPELPYRKTRVRLSASQQAAAFGYVREALTASSAGRNAPLPPPSIPDVGPTRVYLATFARGRAPLVASSAEGTVHDCLMQAVRRLAADPAYAAYASDEMPLRLDLVRWRRKLTVPGGRASKAKVEAGYDGLIVQTPDGPVDQPPWDILYRGWDVPDGAGRARRRLARQFERLSREAGLGADGWKRAHVYTFRTDAYYQPAPGVAPVTLYRGNVVGEPPSGRGRIVAGLVALSDWLAGNLDERGRFRYFYDPIEDEYNPSWHYGVVRHAGAVYGLYAVARRLDDPRYFDAAERAKDYMLSIADPPLFAPDLLSVRQNRLSLLGASALGLLALCEKDAARRTAGEADAMRRLADFLVRMQMEDGSFYTVYLQALLGITPGHQAPYFPGETLLALVRYVQELEAAGEAVDPRYGQAIERAAAYQVAEFKRTGKPDNWTIQALALRAARTGERRDREAVYAMAKYLTDRQYGIGKTSRYRDYAGGFSNSRPPRSTPAASRTEAISAAWRLARAFGDREAKTLGDSVSLAAWFILTQQFDAENAYYLPNPERAIGALRGGLVDSRLRIDYNQHAMIALMGALDVEAYRNSNP